MCSGRDYLDKRSASRLFVLMRLASCGWQRGGCGGPRLSRGLVASPRFERRQRDHGLLSDHGALKSRFVVFLSLTSLNFPFAFSCCYLKLCFVFEMGSVWWLLCAEHRRHQVCDRLSSHDHWY